MLAPHPVLVVAIGAFRPDMAEVGASVFAVAGKAYVDDVDAVLQEGGDVLAAINARVLEPAQVLAVGEVSQPPTERVRVFKSVGSAVEDAAVAAALLRTTPDPALPYG
jgi:ornithine cyclodeaminase/alanine dehydrogenase-like protein (mu-crystallin family)